MDRDGAARVRPPPGGAPPETHPTQEAPLQQRTIGSRKVSAIGLGGMPMSIEGRPDEDRSIRDHPRRARRRRDPHRHRRRLPPATPARSATTRSSSPGRCRRGRAATSDVLVATKGGHLRPGDGSWTQNGRPGAPQGGGQGLAPAARRATRSGSTSSTGPTPTCRTPSRSAPSRDLLDEGVIEMAGISNADRRPDPRGAARCSAAGWCRCRTSSRRRSAAAAPSSTCAPSSASRSCRGARSAASARPATSAAGTTRSRRWPGPTA